MAALRSHIDALNSHCASSAFSQIKLDEDTVHGSRCRSRSESRGHRRNNYQNQKTRAGHGPRRGHGARASLHTEHSAQYSHSVLACSGRGPH